MGLRPSFEFTVFGCSLDMAFSSINWHRAKCVLFLVTVWQLLCVADGTCALVVAYDHTTGNFSCVSLTDQVTRVLASSHSRDHIDLHQILVKVKTRASNRSAREAWAVF